MIDIKCPKCGNYKYDCFDVEYDKNTEDVWASCYCKNCESYFDIKYEATEIELIGDMFDCHWGEVEKRAEWVFNKFSEKYDIALGLWKWNNKLDCSVKVDLDDYDIVFRRCHSKHCNEGCVYLNRNECDGKWMRNSCSDYGYAYKLIKNESDLNEDDIHDLLDSAIMAEKFDGWQ